MFALLAVLGLLLRLLGAALMLFAGTAEGAGERSRAGKVGIVRQHRAAAPALLTMRCADGGVRPR